MMRSDAKLPPLPDLLELIAAGESRSAIGARFNTTRDAVAKAIQRARLKGELPPAQPRVAREKPPPTRRSGATTTARAVNDLTITPRSRSLAVRGQPVLPPPAAPGQPACGAAQLFGSRVCDLEPHDPAKTAHVGAGGPRDPRAEFWGQR